MKGRFTLAINGHLIRGWKRGGKWRFECPSWPGLAEQYRDAESVEEITQEFFRRALAPPAKEPEPCT